MPIPSNRKDLEMKTLTTLLLALCTLTTAVQANDACTADFDGNAVVNFADFLILVGLFGHSATDCAPEADADSLAVVTALRDSISTLQAALDITQYAVTTLQTTVVDLEGERAQQTQRANYWKQSHDTLQETCNAQSDAEEPTPCPTTVTESQCQDLGGLHYLIDGVATCVIETIANPDFPDEPCRSRMAIQPIPPQQPVLVMERFCALSESEITIEAINSIIVAGIITQEQLAEALASSDDESLKAKLGCPTE